MTEEIINGILRVLSYPNGQLYMTLSGAVEELIIHGTDLKIQKRGIFMLVRPSI